MRRLLLFGLMALLSYTLHAQGRLAGFWEGELVKNGITYKLELHLNQRGRILEGKSWLYEPNGRVTEMQVFGEVHRDWSISLYEREPPNGYLAGELFNFPRDYQLLFERSIWEQTLNGYWQKRTGLPLRPTTPHGKVSLRKVKRDPKA